MAKVILLNKEDTREFKEKGYIYIDMYLVVYDKHWMTFEYAIEPSSIEFYDSEYDEVEELIYDQDTTEVVDYDEYYNDEDIE